MTHHEKKYDQFEAYIVNPSDQHVTIISQQPEY